MTGSKSVSSCISTSNAGHEQTAWLPHSEQTKLRSVNVGFCHGQKRQPRVKQCDSYMAYGVQKASGFGYQMSTKACHDKTDSATQGAHTSTSKKCIFELQPLVITSWRACSRLGGTECNTLILVRNFFMWQRVIEMEKERIKVRWQHSPFLSSLEKPRVDYVGRLGFLNRPLRTMNTDVAYSLSKYCSLNIFKTTRSSSDLC